jgi:hypothetical protein
MRNELKWVLAGAAALMLQAMTGAGAEATGVPVPPECEQPDLSAGEQARCDFIARTPNICMRRELSDRTQLWCDQMRFADEPNYEVVRLARNGAVRSIHLIETATGREVVTQYPYGRAFGVPTDDTREVRMKVEELREFLDGRPTPGAIEAPGSSGYATGLPIGWNNSTGVAPDQCLNYTLQSIGDQLEQASFSSQNAATSTAEQIKASATIKGVVDGFSGSNSFSLSDQWQSSTNSSNQYFNFFVLYNLNAVVDSDNPLNGLGQGAGDLFDTTCGSQYLASVPAGMVATISIAYGSSSESTQKSIEDSFGLSNGLDSLNGAVSAASGESDSSFYFAFSMMHYGGGPDASAAMNEAFAATDPTTNEAYYASCAQGDTTACTQFTSSMGTGASSALTAVEDEVASLSSQDNPDLGFLAIFPNGVAGASTQQMAVLDIPVSSADDVLTNYTTPLGRNATLLNEIGTLLNRANQLSQLLQRTNAFNPAVLLDLVSYLASLENIYKTDRQTLLTNLQTCLAASTSNVTSVCADLEQTESETAFEWYAEGGENPNFLAQQNTLALQYTGLDGATPLDVLYIDQLPPFTAAGSNIPIAGEAAFVGFQDRPPPVGNPAAYVDILTLEPGEPLSTDNVSSKVRNNPTDPSPFTLWNINAFAGLALEPVPNSFFTSNACTPTFAAPCAIDYSFGASGTQDVQNVQIENLFQ